MDGVQNNSSVFSYLNDTQVNPVIPSYPETMAENITGNISTLLPQVLAAATTTPSIADTTPSTPMVTQATTTTASWLLNLTTQSPIFPYQLEPPTMEPKNATTGPKVYHPQPGMAEFLIILGLIGIMLYIAAKYVGCKLSWICCTCGEKSGNDHIGVHEGRYARRENAFQRPEYERTLQYAVYSRPVTARISTLIDARGYGYSLEDEEEDHVTFYSRGKDGKPADAPPDYDSLVPPSYNTNYNYYQYSDPVATRPATAIARPSTANPFLADSRL